MRWFGWFRRQLPLSAPEPHVGSGAKVVAGRLRVRGVPYNLPRDLEEMNRLDFQHYLFRAALRGNFVAPIDRPGAMLDVGTGTGRWAREMAQTFPQAAVIGLDIHPPPVDEAGETQQRTDLLPPNYTFVSGNVLEGLPFADASFDFVHMRMLVSAIPHDRWPFVAQELVRVTRTGGWVESVEALLPTNGGPVAEQPMDWIRAISLRREVDIADATHVQRHLAAAGLTQVTLHELTIPCGNYGGRIGKMMATDYFAGVKAVGGVMVAQGLTTQDHFDKVLTQAMQDIASPRYRCVFPVFVAYGQRTF